MGGAVNSYLNATLFFLQELGDSQNLSKFLKGMKQKPDTETAPKKTKGRTKEEIIAAVQLAKKRQKENDTKMAELKELNEKKHALRQQANALEKIARKSLLDPGTIDQPSEGENLKKFYPRIIEEPQNDIPLPEEPDHADPDIEPVKYILRTPELGNKNRKTFMSFFSPRGNGYDDRVKIKRWDAEKLFQAIGDFDSGHGKGSHAMVKLSTLKGANEETYAIGDMVIQDEYLEKANVRATNAGSSGTATLSRGDGKLLLRDQIRDIRLMLIDIYKMEEPAD